ncbi:hypothetical protein [Celeribacter sp.]|uniref:hypothetical protein n=1 Tax=Celeribacter sp. TaxID=1890673 RepID=UPI003A8EE7F6
MGGFELVKRAFGSVLNNLDSALAISGLLWIGLIALQIIVGPIDPEKFMTMTATPDEVFGAFTTAISMAVVSLWVAVAWHRFVLLGEAPRTVVPAFRVKPILAYLGWSILIVFVLSLVFSVALAVLSPFYAMLSQVVAVSVWQLALSVVLSYAFFRVSPVLPAVAVGNSASLRLAWKRTKPLASDIWGVAVVFTLISVIIPLPAILLGTGLIGVIYTLVSGWVMLMVGVSLLTTIYHETEGAEL